MTATTEREPRSPAGILLDHWRTFWFMPEPATTLGVVRAAFGVLVIGWTLCLLPDLTNLLSDHGVMPRPRTDGAAWTVLEASNSDGALFAVWGFLLASSIALTVGWHSRLAALAVVVCVMSFERASPFVFNSGDGLIRIESLFLLLAPTGAALSLDRRRTAGSFWSAQERAPWVLRLMQVQLTLIYLFSVQGKLSGDTWSEGTAVSYALRIRTIGNVVVPDWITMNALLMNAVTWGALAAELVIGVLVWNRRWRPYVLAGGVVLHAIMMITFAIGFFSFAMYVLYLAFVPPERMQKVVDRLRRVPLGPPFLRAWQRGRGGE